MRPWQCSWTQMLRCFGMCTVGNPLYLVVRETLSSIKFHCYFSFLTNKHGNATQRNIIDVFLPGYEEPTNQGWSQNIIWLTLFFSFLLQTGGGIRHAVKIYPVFFPGRRKGKTNSGGAAKNITALFLFFVLSSVHIYGGWFLGFNFLSFLPCKTEFYKHHIHIKYHIKER